jgi:hypothetical protein
MGLHLEVPFVGAFEKIDSFFDAIGIKSKNGYVIFSDFALIYGGGLSAELTIVITTNKNLRKVESDLISLGIPILDSGFDASGPYLTIKDPSGIRTTIACTNESFTEMISEVNVTQKKDRSIWSIFRNK